ncbi:MAG TPA: tetratricopeptide repeat protein [bacterium]|nr:tetratricopeptide repeat protein [bacterium]
MASWRASVGCWLLLLAGCAGVAPNPAAASVADLPVVELSEARSERLAGFEARAVDAVVRRHYREARSLARRALALDPRSARARAVLGMVLLQDAARSEPVEWTGLRKGEFQIELARRLAPNDAFVGWIRAVFLAETGHMSAAAAAAEQALVDTTGAPAAERAALLGTAGTYRYELGEERAALPHLEAYVALRPDDASAQFRLGACLLALAAVPQGDPPQYEKAMIQAEGAAAAFARCFALAPGDEDAALAVATARLRAGELAALSELPDSQSRRDAHRRAAREHLRALAERFPDSPEVHFRIGVALADDPRLAAASYRAALERDPMHVGSALNLAALAIAGGEPDRAREIYAGLLARDAEVRRTGREQRAGDRLTRDERQRIERWLAENQTPRML